ncbi:methyltransferase, partial [Bdellovibrionota bacterium FG-2]
MAIGYANLINILARYLSPRTILTLQFGAMLFVAVAPVFDGTFPPVPFVYPLWHQAVGAVILALGTLLLALAALSMGRNFTVHPNPKGFELVVKWPFTWVRNPIYLGGLLMAAGWSLRCNSCLTGISALLLW